MIVHVADAIGLLLGAGIIDVSLGRRRSQAVVLRVNQRRSDVVHIQRRVVYDEQL